MNAQREKMQEMKVNDGSLKGLVFILSLSLCLQPVVWAGEPTAQQPTQPRSQPVPLFSTPAIKDVSIADTRNMIGSKLPARGAVNLQTSTPFVQAVTSVQRSFLTALNLSPNTRITQIFLAGEALFPSKEGLWKKRFVVTTEDGNTFQYTMEKKGKWNPPNGAVVFHLERAQTKTSTSTVGVSGKPDPDGAGVLPVEEQPLADGSTLQAVTQYCASQYLGKIKTTKVLQVVSYSGEGNRPSGWYATVKVTTDKNQIFYVALSKPKDDGAGSLQYGDMYRIIYRV